MHLLQFEESHLLLNPVDSTNTWVPNYKLWLHSQILTKLMFCIGAASCPDLHPNQTRTVTSLSLDFWHFAFNLSRCGLKVNFWSKRSLRNLTSCTIFICCLSKYNLGVRTGWFVLLKRTREILVCENLNTFLQVHSDIRSNTSFSFCCAMCKSVSVWYL